MDVWNSWGSVPPTRLRTTEEEEEEEEEEKKKKKKKKIRSESFPLKYLISM